MSDGPDALEKRKYTEPEWLQIGADRQHAVEEAEIAHEIAQNRIKSVRKPVMVAGILFLTSMVLSAVGILTLITFMIGGGLAATALAYTLFQLKLSNEQAGVTKYDRSTRQQLKRRQHEFYVWQQIDLADTGEYKKVPKPPEENLVKLNPGESVYDTQQIDTYLQKIESLKKRNSEMIAEISKVRRHLESGVGPKALASTKKYPSKSTNRYNPSDEQLYLTSLDLSYNLSGNWEVAETKHSKFLYRLHDNCQFMSTDTFVFNCQRHQVWPRSYSIEEFVSCLEEHDGCKLIIHMLPEEYLGSFYGRKPYRRKT